MTYFHAKQHENSLNLKIEVNAKNENNRNCAIELEMFDSVLLI